MNVARYEVPGIAPKEDPVPYVVIGEAAICEDGRSRIIPRADNSGQGVVTGSKKVAFDTCYAGYSDPTANATSALYEVGGRLKAKNNACNLELVGATGPAVTIGALGYSVSFPLVGGIDLSVLGGNPTSDWSSRIPGSDMQVACRTRRRSFTK